MAAGLGQHLHDLAVGQRALQLSDLPVNLGTHAGMADLCVDGVGEIDRCRIPRQGNDLSLRREYVNLLRVEVNLQRG